jgi:hypothetical protein
MPRSVGFAQLYPLVALICDTLDRLRITYVVCGSVAAYLHGHRARETHDVDVLADVQARHVSRLSAALREPFFNAETHSINEALDLAEFWRSGGQTVNRPSINLMYRPLQTLHVDIFLPIGANQSREWRWEQAQFANRVREPLSISARSESPVSQIPCSPNSGQLTVAWGALWATTACNSHDSR